ncbi:unnamed protein product [Porites evermanni]|uniref:Uncharacterized protein n=1 Tax=Porites evermanni TaxID=104178 RepID=A0ABN8SR77_9CNID|nr:unnamed protein product [Porites evermanni]
MKFTIVGTIHLNAFLIANLPFYNIFIFFILSCVSGLGVSCLAAAVLLLSLDEFMSPDHVISKMRQVRGQRAFQTVKQYNFVHEFRDMYKAYQDEQRNSTEVAAPRSLSR